MTNFLPVKRFEGLYLINRNGVVIRLERTSWNGFGYFLLKQKEIKRSKTNGYISVALTRNTHTKNYYLHRLLAEVFIANPKGKPQINHIDGNKLNNALGNLEWCTPRENLVHAFKTGLNKGKSRFGSDNPQSKLTPTQVEKIREMKGKDILKNTAAMFNMSISQTWAIQNNVSRKGVIT